MRAREAPPLSAIEGIAELVASSALASDATDGGVRTPRVLEMYPLRALARTGGLPSADVPSDHVPLVCERAVGD